MTIFLRAAAMAVFLDLVWTSTTFFVGQDASGRSIKLMGFAIAWGLAACLALVLPTKEGSARLRFVVALPILVGWGAFLVVVSSPYSFVERIPVLFMEGGASRVGIAIGLLLVVPLFSITSFVARERRSHSLILLGAATGWGLHELVLLPEYGWVWGSLIWMGILFGATILTREKPGRPTGQALRDEDKLVRRSLNAVGGWVKFSLWILVAAGVFSVCRYFLLSRLSGTRFTEVLLFGSALAGLGLGGLLAAVGGFSKWPGLVRGVVFFVGVAGGALLPLLFLARLARAGDGTPIEQDQFLTAALIEGYAVLSVISLGSVLMGFVLSAAVERPAPIFTLGVGAWIGPGLVMSLIPAHIQIDLLTTRGADLPLQTKLTDDGVLRLIRSFDRSRDARVHWNREAVSRNRDWARLEEQEILLTSRRSLKTESVLIFGTVFSSHRKMIPESGFQATDYVDPLPPFVASTPRGDERDPFRFLAIADKGQYDVILRLSRPFYSAGAGLLHSADALRQTASLLTEDGKLFYWIDVRATVPSALKTLLRTFFEVFPTGNLWYVQDGLTGPLLCLESKTDAPRGSGEPGEYGVRLATGQSLLQRLPQERIATASFPGIELALPLTANPMPLASSTTLRALRDLLSSDSEERGAMWYILEGLALQEADLVAPTNRFSDPAVWVQVSKFAVKMFSEGLKKFPQNKTLVQVLARAGWILFDKNEFEQLFELVPVWLEVCPDDSAFLELLGSVHVELLDYELSLPLLQRAAGLAPESVSVHRTLGIACAELAYWPEAVDAFTVAYAVNPEDGAVGRDLGLACFEVGDYEQAMAFLQKASQDFPENAKVQAALRAMRELEGSDTGS